MTGFVYYWSNNLNQKWYIGSHKGTPDDGYISSSKVFKRAVEKYGIENFTRIILYRGENYRQVEDDILKMLKAAQYFGSYNLRNSSKGGIDGYKHSEETKAKISKAHIGKIVSEETKTRLSLSHIGNAPSEESRKKSSLSNKGQKRSEEFCERISNARKGIIFTEEQLINMSSSHIGNKHTEETKAKMSRSRKGVKKSEEHIRKVAEANRGKTKSDETKAKISKANKEVNERKRLLRNQIIS